ncbi:ATP-binding protein [Pantoea rwandensis]|uniref:ATP-binding protein n=3 Tax=Pantoea TaxID=53335 RepID=UPI001CD5936D|nr:MULTISPECIES: ATP-binding protein [unclassified Pantoea]MCA1178914.1 ATP-binding protein [Pantoea sp. alder69]MCA1267403.1 ATP-binding protein [Pantoea sp. alder81]
MKFEKAMRKKAKLRLALTGPSGSGKTYSALLVAKGIGGRIAVLDTEKGSASLYSDVADFDVLELEPPFAPERFIEAIIAAEQAGYDTLVLDSITHEWSGVGGCLELVDTIAKAKFRGNSWSAWSEINPRHRLFLDAILRSPMHIIATMRSKTETAQVEENGRKKVAKLGMKSEQRDGVEYEFTTVLDIGHETHHAIASKDRTKLFSNADPVVLGEETGKQLLNWLESGANPLEESLKVFTEAAHTAADMESLKALFEEAWRTLRGSEYQAKAKEIYDLRKSDFDNKSEAA